MSSKFDDGLYLSDAGPRIRFNQGPAGSRTCNRGQADAIAHYPTVLMDGHNRILCAYTSGGANFTAAQFVGIGTNLNGLDFRTDIRDSTMLLAIINKKATTNSLLAAIEDNSYIRLEIRTVDAIQSELAGQVDIAMPWRSINIVSPDLLHEPERSQDANSQLPILSSSHWQHNSTRV